MRKAVWVLVGFAITGCSSTGVGGGVGIGKGGGVGVGIGVGMRPRQQNTGIGPRVIFLGDSIVAAQDVDTDQGFAWRSIDRLNAYFMGRRIARRVEAVYAGVPGAQASSGPPRMREILANDKGTILFLELGVNDLTSGTPAASVEKSLDETMAIAKDAGLQIVLAEMTNPPPPRPQHPNAAEYRALYERLAKKYGAILVPAFLEGVAGDKDLTLDGLHPNRKGHAKLADKLVPYLEVALEVPGATLPAPR